MSPYYADDLVTLWLGDCRELIAAVGPFDVVVTDPPYGVGWDVDGGSRNWTRRRMGTQFEPIVGDDAPFDPSAILAFGKPTAMFGGNHYADRLPASPSWMVWYKRPLGMRPTDQADCELVWTNLGGPARLYHQVWQGGGSLAAENGIPAGRDKPVGIHPTQKPVGLMRWIIGQCPDGVILDPYAGSGSTLVAAKSLNRRAVGIEISERYCEVAARRLSQEVLGLVP